MMADPSCKRRALKVIRNVNEIFSLAAKVQNPNDVDVSQVVQRACPFLELALCRGLDARDGDDCQGNRLIRPFVYAFISNRTASAAEFNRSSVTICTATVMFQKYCALHRLLLIVLHPS